MKIDEGDPPALTALINASSDTTSNLDTSFILRQYNNPNANRQGEDEAESLGPSTAGETPAMSSPTQVPASAIHNMTSSPLTESLPACSSEFRDNPLPDMSLSPYDDYNLAAARGVASPLNGEFPDLDTPSENIWGLWDLFPDNLEELFPGQPMENSQGWGERR